MNSVIVLPPGDFWDTQTRSNAVVKMLRQKYEQIKLIFMHNTYFEWWLWEEHIFM